MPDEAQFINHFYIHNHGMQSIVHFDLIYTSNSLIYNIAQVLPIYLLNWVYVKYFFNLR